LYGVPVKGGLTATPGKLKNHPVAGAALDEWLPTQPSQKPMIGPAGGIGDGAGLGAGGVGDGGVGVGVGGVGVGVGGVGGGVGGECPVMSTNALRRASNPWVLASMLPYMSPPEPVLGSSKLAYHTIIPPRPWEFTS